MLAALVAQLNQRPTTCMPTLDWLNRDATFEIARKVPYRLLEQVSEHASTAQMMKAPLHKGSEREKQESRQSVISGLELTSNKAFANQANVSLERVAIISGETLR